MASLSFATPGMYFSLNFTRKFQVSSSPVDLAPPFTISHQCSAYPWNIKVVKATLWFSVHFITSNIFSICRSHSSACIGSASPLNAGGCSFWNYFRALYGLVLVVNCANHLGTLSGIFWLSLSCSTTTSWLVGGWTLLTVLCGEVRPSESVSSGGRFKSISP